MGDSPKSVTSLELRRLVGTSSCPRIFDVRREQAYAQAEDLIPTAAWRDHRSTDIGGNRVSSGGDVVVYCVHGHQVSQSAAALLRSLGVRARYLEGGIEAYRESGGPVVSKKELPNRREDEPSRWVTCERPEIDALACLWFVRRFVDRDAVVHFVSSDWVEDVAVELDATPVGVPRAVAARDGDRCGFDGILARFEVSDPALARLAAVVRGAETGRLDLAPQAAGLHALSRGLAAVEADDGVLLAKGLVVCDALYGWCRIAAAESHDRPAAESGAAGDIR